MRKAFLLVLCFILCCSAAMAENGMNLGADGNDWLTYACTLPDGRLLFTGSRATPGNYQDSRARLLCLNPDLSVSWEYWDPAEGKAHFSGAALLPDGTIGIIYTNAPYQETEAIEIRKFTMEGKQIGEAVDIFQNGKTSSLVDSITSACIQLDVYTEAGKEQRGFLDWNGNLMFSFGIKENIGLRSTFAVADGLVLAGNEAGGSANAKIMKMDMQGNIIWETVLPMMMENGARAWIDKCVQTPDGGFLAWVIESDYNSDHWAHALVRFDANGRKLWQNRESFDETPTIGCLKLFEYQGKSIMLVRNDDNKIRSAMVYRWFDSTGEEIGKTELVIPWEDATGATAKDPVEAFNNGIFIAGDKLWSLYEIRIENDDVRKEMDSSDPVLYQVPAL